MTLKDELPRSVGSQYAAGEVWRNNYRKNEDVEPKQKQRPIVDVTDDGSKVRFCKEKWSTEVWNVRSMKLVMNREAWSASVHGVTKSWTRLSD